MKKKRLLLMTVIIGCMTVCMNFTVGKKLIIKNVLFQNIEALADESDEELPPEVHIQCLSDKEATYVVGNFVVPNAYYSPH